MELRVACMPCTSMSFVACLNESLRDVPAVFAKLARPSMSGRSCVAFWEKFFQSEKRTGATGLGVVSRAFEPFAVLTAGRGTFGFDRDRGSTGSDVRAKLRRALRARARTGKKI
jgi:hypothetical protein